MKWSKKYAKAWNTLERVSTLREHIQVLEQMAAQTESSALRVTSICSHVHAKGNVTREDAVCKYIDLKPQLETIKKQYDEAVKIIENALVFMPNPAEELLLRTIYVYGADKHLVMVMSGMSPSGFRAKLERAVASFDTILKREGGMAA